MSQLESNSLSFLFSQNALKANEGVVSAQSFPLRLEIKEKIVVNLLHLSTLSRILFSGEFKRGRKLVVTGIWICFYCGPFWINKMCREYSR